ncbi:SAM-dependent methyltransferase [Phaeovibrio sulfidiphilus]|uniref:SAM-dependent methyltransferase n=2 Tax=Phaeovibrio sulfidiphilus TaxID=1220600 RepID=A0A8J6YML4_9PROT|nr:SAM-dependent methyltransferase [Phaeovibrio sulfidiphilus]MBE1236086.1 SAM-dependent methyltransferase [Phaeovibrio sulfidiphilus]
MGLCAQAYYARGTAIGARGDFITAPECTQIFGELLGLWAVVVWQSMGSPAGLILAEAGPGRGTLMRDALRASRLVPAFGAAVSVALVETSPALRRQQEQALADSPVPVRWFDRLEDLPDAPLILLANEFLDALPIRQYQRSADGWCERRVRMESPDPLRLAFCLSPPLAGDPPFLQPAHRKAQPGEWVETCPAAHAVVEALARRFATRPGAALFLDYGPAASAPGDSLQALKGHAYAPLLDEPGAVDLTAHVDFQALAHTARAAGAGVEPLVRQGAFLTSLGLLERARALQAGTADESQKLAIADAVRRLVDPLQMGSLFKVMGMRSEGLAPLPGFSGPAG